MSKGKFAVLVALCTVLFHLVSCAQEFPGLATGYSNQQSASLGTRLSAVDPGIITVRPTAMVGWQKMGANISFPIPVDPDSGIRPLEFQLLDANLWTGGVGLEVSASDTLAFYLGGQANARRNVTVVTSIEPVFIGEFGDVDWTGSQVEWWAIDGGVSLRIFDGLRVVAGLRRDHFSLKLNDPRLQGVPLVSSDLFFGYRGDLQTKLWIPYLGFDLTGPNYVARLTGSPFTQARVKLPLRINFVLGDFNDLEYSLTKPGGFLEGLFIYTVNPRDGFSCSLYAQANWLNVKGRGTEDFVETGIDPLGPFSSSATATFARYMTCLGVSLQLIF